MNNQNNQNFESLEKRPLVSICTTTFNHENYIQEALDSFLMQETNFEFEIVINDDASTDKTALIIKKYEKKYPHIIKPTYQTENQYSKGVSPMTELVLPRACGKYIAMCEGDDYWTDQNKLQKQVDFLEDNKEYKFCFTRFHTKEESTQHIKEDQNGRYFKNSGTTFDFNKFEKGWHIGTQTILFKADTIIPRLDQIHKKYNNYIRDIILYTELLNQGNGYCLIDFTAVYRIQVGGVYTGASKAKTLKQGVFYYQLIYSKNRKNTSLRQKYINFSNIYIFNLIELGEFSKAAREIINQYRLINKLKLLIKNGRMLLGAIKSSLRK